MKFIKICSFVFFVFIISTAHSIELKKLKTFNGAGAPKSVEVSPDGKYAVIMNLEGMDLWVIDTNTLMRKEVISFAPFKTSAMGHNYTTHKAISSFAEKPVEAAFSGNGKYVWTSFHNGAAVVRFNLENPLEQGNAKLEQKARVKSGNKTFTVRMPKIKVGSTPKVICVTPDEKYTLVANWFGNSISVIDNASLTKVKDIIVGSQKYRRIPRGICVNSTSTKAYVCNMRGGTISIIDLTTLRKTGDLPITPNPRHINISNDDRYLFITDNRDGLVIKYDLQAKRTAAKKFIGGLARSLVISPDNKYIYAVAHKDNKVVVLDSSNLSILRKYEFYKPMGISVSPDGKQVWVSSYGGGYVSVYKVVE